MKTTDIYLEYLRKSREDLEYEKININEKTLERHKERLKIISESAGKPVEPENIYEEVVSGDNIKDRPQMQRLLKDIENPNIKGVWVIDVQRLCRGDLGDQDRIIKTFKYSNTLILTPEKEYNLNNPSDEEYLIDKLSYSLKEYKHIKKRLLEGRKDSVRAGLFISGIPAYGYERYKLKGERGFSLRIVPEQAEIVKLIFKLCLEGKGTFSIANYLNNLGIKSPKNSEWRKNRIREMLHNQTYAGYVKWQERTTINVIENGTIKKKTIRQKNGDYMLIKGRHEAIISEEDFNLVQEKLKACSTKYVKEGMELKNPLAGILRCSECGRVMARRDVKTSVYYKPRGSRQNPVYYPAKPIVFCAHNCNTKTHVLEYVEQDLIDALKQWLKEHKEILLEYEKQYDSIINEIVNQKEILNNELNKQKNKLERLRSFLEEEVYDKKTYLERSKPIIDSISILEQQIMEITEENEQIKIDNLKSFIPKVELCINEYFNLNVKEKNELLHSIIKEVRYTKTKTHKDSDLKLDLYMKI